ncbi:PaaI family thioesterase [bacterium 210820-DFI.6.37]|nr:PaaI family thioesterase [bacterium 210820-DFI.6.37]
MELEKRFEEILNHIKHPKELRLNNMLDPYFLGGDEEELVADILFCTQDWERNQRNEIHGGSIAAMFDTAMGVTAAVFEGSGSVSTADLQVSFIRPFLSGAFIFTTQITSIGKTLIRATCVAREKQSGKIVATASGTFVPFKK